MSSDLIGVKVFDPSNNSLYRIAGSRNNETIKCLSYHTNKLINMRIDDVNKMCKLKPVGYLYLFEVTLSKNHNDKDIVICFLRQCDIDKGIEKPFIVGRYAIQDIYAQNVSWNVLGCITSLLSCPNNIDYDIFTIYHKVLNKSIFTMYLNDNLDTILQYIKPNRWDHLFKYIIGKVDPNQKHNKLETLKSYLINNKFMYEFCNSFNIVTLDVDDEVETFKIIDMPIVEPTNVNLIIEKVEDKIGYKVNPLGFIYYDESTSLSKLTNTNFIFIKNNVNSNKVYIMKFSKGEKIKHAMNADSINLINNRLRNKNI